MPERAGTRSLGLPTGAPATSRNGRGKDAHKVFPSQSVHISGILTLLTDFLQGSLCRDVGPAVPIHLFKNVPFSSSVNA
jgi:hypothetical protein